MHDDEIVLIKYNPLFFSEMDKALEGNIYFIFEALNYLYSMYFISKKDVDYCR